MGDDFSTGGSLMPSNTTPHPPKPLEVNRRTLRASHRLRQQGATAHVLHNGFASPHVEQSLILAPFEEEGYVYAFAALIGVDWSDKKHDIALQAADSTAVELSVVAHTPETIHA
ncbi:hypothetical protein HJG54_12620 [Leptolyngbya sp. NK1-12]|uniref:Uncharacterized protein n=1 Tax=Leptolyngbya sp. NK1-12 TaxID=2547451 RepID=A0AA97AI99_9CYAN|nr:hypothetical protein [Leptolyngbya sp. NK1-12]WNZ23611.1 hypothetical protein HJG54_12620 [Leptolyngbya sp. NK1-12]